MEVAGRKVTFVVILMTFVNPSKNRSKDFSRTARISTVLLTLQRTPGNAAELSFQ